jgi:hypothetical protein
MKNAQKPDHVSLNTLIGRLREGRYLVPDFQREFEWKPWDIRDLMRSIFLDYYIGSLLLWKGSKDNFETLSCEPIYAFNGQENPEYIVLDGQQRLTAMYYAFFAPDKELPSRSKPAIYSIKVDKFIAEEYDLAFNYDWVSRRTEQLMLDREKQFQEHFFPLSIISSDGWELANWVQDYEKYWLSKADENQIAKQHADNAKAFGEHLRDITGQYQISYIELDRDLAIDKVCDIFTQINSKGIRLDIFDLINALLKPRGLQLKHMWRDAASRLEFANSDKMNVYILQVMSILRQGYCSPKYLYFLLPGQEKPVRDPDGTRRKEILVKDTEDFNDLWQRSVGALEATIKRIRHPQEYGVISSKYLPYVSILPAFAALESFGKKIPKEGQLDAERKIRHWYWASIFMNRYSGSVESTSARDYLDVKGWITDDRAEPAFIREFKNGFQGIDLTKETKRGSSIYNGIFNLLIIQGARDWITGSVPLHDDLDDHHIVPASWGNKNSVGNRIHTILNRTPLSADTNRNAIGDKLPNEYLPRWIAKNGENAVRGILESHSISPKAFDILMRNPFTVDDFSDFISERQKTIKNSIESLLIKERLDLPPQLRELDVDIENVELQLRKAISERLENDFEMVPSHVRQRIEERLQKAKKKSAIFDTERYLTFAGKMEFSDLREIQDIITAKPLWDKFSDMFGSKEALVTKFDQLAELRNGIRYSRHVNDVVKKEGEAALLWFREIFC